LKTLPINALGLESFSNDWHMYGSLNNVELFKVLKLLNLVTLTKFQGSVCG